ncbi:hypothetical protein TTRE_0000631101 [Trichuris trichiura]|uniref:Uncharacterized protein n=1 Tax=Trichuris trichiura TaxID=36087 RepID=A0A077ZH73_TRITR|nr:hypothetical protein TTRE_0000631101 [Trichuris trichiura]
MQDNESVLQEYQLTLREIGSASTSNERRRQLLENMPKLDSISDIEFLCHILLSENSDLPVIMFSIAKLENRITSELPFAEPQRRRHLFQTIFNLSHSYDVAGKPICAVRKLMSIAANITRHSDEADAAEYFLMMLEMITCEKSRPFAIKLLKVSIEEFVESNRCKTLPYERLQHMKAFAVQQTSQFYSLIIELISKKLAAFLPCAYPVREVPPGFNISSVLEQFISVLKATNDSFAKAVRNNFDQLTLELSCLGTLVRTVEADSLVGDHSLHIIYVLAFVGLQLTVQPMDPTCLDISELAVSCLQQLSERQWSLRSVEKSEMVFFLASVFSDLQRAPQSLDVLQSVLITILPTIKGRLPNSRFQNALRLLHLYANCFYAKQVENIPSGFLHNQLVCLDKSQHVDTCRTFCECWASMLDAVILRMETVANKQSAQPASYLPEGFCAAFGLALLRKLALFEVADEDDEPAETIEWFDSGSLPRFCLELLALLARVDINSQWHIVMGEYERTAASVQRCIVEVFHSGASVPFNNMDSSEVAQVNDQLRQYRCVIKAACCLTGPFDAWNCGDHFERCYEFLTRHCEMTLLLTRSFFNKPTSIYGVFEEPIVSTMATALLCFRSYSPWLSSCYADAQQSGNRNVEVSLLVSTALNAVTAVLRDSQFCGKLAQAAVLTLRSILLTIRPHSFVLSMNGIQSLYRQSIDGLYKCLPDDIRNALYVSLANYLILPWYNAVGEEQEWSQRKPVYEQLIRSILADYFAVVDAEQSVPYEMAAPVIKKAAPLIVALLDSIENESAVTKRTCYDVMRLFGKGTLSLLVLYKQHLDCVQSLLELLSHLLRTLIMQFGVDFTKQLSCTLFDLCTSTDFFSGLQADTKEATSVLECFVSVLSTIVVQTSSKFSSLLPEVVALVIGPLFNAVRKVSLALLNLQQNYE